MKEINVKTIKKLANNVAFELTDEEAAYLLNEFSAIEEYSKILTEAELHSGTEQLTPLIYPTEIITDYMRDDEQHKELDKQEILGNTGKVEGGQVVVPRVVG